MRNYVKITISILFLLAISSCKKPETDILYTKKYVEEIKEARKNVAFYMAQNSIPGANVAVSIDGQLIYSEGFGLASKDLGVKASRRTKFRIGDVSSLFTNVLYHKMIENGVLHPDSSVRYYFPEFPEKEHKLTLFHLANEVSGLRPPINDVELKQINSSIQQGIRLFKDEEMDVPPGVLQEPNSFNYNLLGAVMEKASGEKFRDLLSSYLTDTLKLQNTTIDNPFVTIENRSDFYEPNIIAQVVNAMFYDLRTSAPSKGLLSNAEDMVKLGNTILSGDYLSESTKRSFFEPVKLFNDNLSRMANGWVVLTNPNGQHVYGREGTVPGGAAAILLYPDENMVVAYACNVSSTINDTPVFVIANAFLNGDQQEPEKGTVGE